MQNSDTISQLIFFFKTSQLKKKFCLMGVLNLKTGLATDWRQPLWFLAACSGYWSYWSFRQCTADTVELGANEQRQPYLEFNTEPRYTMKSFLTITVFAEF